MAERRAGRSCPTLDTVTKGLAQPRRRIRGLDRLVSRPARWEVLRLGDRAAMGSSIEGAAFAKPGRDQRLSQRTRGEVGKTSLIRALHSEDVIQGKEPMTQGVAI